jgi:hypothetical protein
MKGEAVEENDADTKRTVKGGRWKRAEAGRKRKRQKKIGAKSVIYRPRPDMASFFRSFR